MEGVLLLPCHFEAAALVAVSPGSGHRIAGHFALDHIVNDLAAVALSIEFQIDGSGIPLEYGFSDRKGSNAGEDGAAKIRIFPLQVHADRLTPSLTDFIISGPSPARRFTGRRRRRDLAARGHQQKGNCECRQEHCTSKLCRAHDAVIVSSRGNPEK